MLGERESGTARLDEAVAAYREALQENTRARDPFLWAFTQKNLALVYRALLDKGPPARSSRPPGVSNSPGGRMMGRPFGPTNVEAASAARLSDSDSWDGMKRAGS